MSTTTFIRFIRTIAVLSILMFFAGCGGGGGDDGGGGSSETVSGVAASGAPIIGYAYLKDSAGHTEGPVKIATDGKFSFDVTGLTAPFYLMAEGTVAERSIQIYSASIGVGTANINPITDLAVANATGATLPSDVYNDPESYPITQDNLDAAIEDIQYMLQPLLDAYSVTNNPLTDSYTANHTGLDAVFDVITVTVFDDGDVDIINKITNDIMGQTTTSNIGDADQVTNIPDTQTITDIQNIAEVLSTFATSLNAGSSLESYFATSYGVNNGLDRDGNMEDWRNIKNFMNRSITRITDLAIASKDGLDYKITFIMYFSDGTFFSSDALSNIVVVTKENGSWKFKGNGYLSDSLRMVEVGTYIEAYTNSTEASSALGFEIEDVGNNDLQSAIVTGPGLPDGGLHMTKSITSNILLPDGQGNGKYELTDDEVDGLPEDNLVYTFMFYDSSDNLVETRTKTFAKRPYKVSELVSGYIPVLGGVTSHALSAAHIGGTLSYTYSLPTAYQTSALSGGFSCRDASHHYTDDGSLSLTGTSASKDLSSVTFTPEAAELRLGASDIYGRLVSYKWYFGI